MRPVPLSTARALYVAGLCGRRYDHQQNCRSTSRTRRTGVRRVRGEQSELWGGADLNDLTLSRLGRAARWLQRLEQSPNDQSLRERCQRWRDATPENAQAFERMVLVWQAIGQLAAASCAALEISDMSDSPVRPIAVNQRGRHALQRSRSARQTTIRACAPESVSPARQRPPRAAQPGRPPAQE
jgi:hypothetical protein